MPYTLVLALLEEDKAHSEYEALVQDDMIEHSKHGS